MIRMNPIRFAAYGAAAGAVAGVFASAGIIAGQAIAARRRPSLDPRRAPAMVGDQGPTDGTPLRLVMLGDSIAASVGAGSERASLAGRLIRALVADGNRVAARTVAVPNSYTVDVKIQASRALITSESDPYDIAVIVVGAMDVCAWTSPRAIEHVTARTITALVNRGIRVVLATTPDMGSVPCVKPPLRWLWGLRTGQVTEAQINGALAGGAEVVNLAELTGDAFSGDASLYAEDGFHPSADGYRIIADAIAPTVRAAARARRAV
ncbi:SGNH/GDSL hydrolase family protein [Cumulibacter soli]|uniref:SGNH/GDSL hydrolase family protein n=1 Tax=Cumulibacter soli TaxID=2546344 RepID=UPI00141966C1|nr:SGNH/GDSL hydrolase family protein [Cumulibacter soli]